MFLLNYIYVCIYQVLKKTFNRYVFDAPEVYAVGFLSVMYSASFLILNNWLFFDTWIYKKEIRISLFVIFFIGINIFQIFYYLKTDKYKILEKQLKGSFFIGMLIMIFWVFIIYWYISNYWKVG